MKHLHNIYLYLSCFILCVFVMTVVWAILNTKIIFFPMNLIFAWYLYRAMKERDDDDT